MSADRVYGTNISLPPLADLFSTQEDRDDANLEKVQLISLDELHPFPNHPFQVRDDDEMEKLSESIKDHGVLLPAIVRPRKEGGYELISGHRRKHACELAKLTEMPVLVRDMDDDAAILLMVDSNVQREHILPSEKAKAYKMKMDALNRQGERTDLTSGQVGPKLRSDELMAEGADDSARQIKRYIRLNNLIPELMDMVDENKLKFNPAVEISYLTPDEQNQIFEYLESQECTPSLSQAQKLKAASKEQTLTEAALEKIMTSQPPSVKPRPQQVNLPMEKLTRYFPPNATSDQIVSQILRVLEAYYRSHNRGGMER